MHGGGMMLLVRGGTVVTAEASFRIDILCGDDGEIAAIGPALDIPTGCDVLDAGGLLVMPGGVDPHTRIGPDEQRIAALAPVLLAAGTTTVIECVGVPRGRGMRAAWQDWRRGWRHAVRGGGVDFSAHMVIGQYDGDVARGMAEVTQACGVNSFRLSCGGEMDDTQVMGVIDHAMELGALCALDAHGGLVAAYLRAGLDRAGIDSAEAQALSCAAPVEGSGIARAIMMAGMLGAPVHVGPVSTRDAVDAITAARLRGQRVSAEVLPRHLVLDGEGDEVFPGCDALPPLRDGAQHAALWGGLASGMLGMSASGAGADGGLAGEACMPDLAGRMGLLWHHGVRAGRLSAEDFVAMTSANAARAFNIYPRKGAIMVGADADLLLWDAHGAAHVLSSCYGAPVVSGAVVHVVRGGVVAYSATQACVAGGGRHVDRPCFGRDLAPRVRRRAHLAAQG
ncbi:amidohydrolase family protein [Novacetimonas hansenii]|uniref:amidohydrolase family protein n=1 Tax=Novacetimonas hansenii TaxID=436 RepID=UPI00248E6078|nr:amidohydrolase family protein [Novacetimonas hansenii]